MDERPTFGDEMIHDLAPRVSKSIFQRVYHHVAFVEPNGLPMCRRIGCSGLPLGTSCAVGTIGLLDTSKVGDDANVAVLDAGARVPRSLTAAVVSPLPPRRSFSFARWPKPVVHFPATSGPIRALRSSLSYAVWLMGLSR